ncbi:MAG: S53 family peptidase [Paludisphaera borealis]|uniref:S53 family peptidase n=1 Tax=Paludisphaera borealis TaxID=1387353 RepID=UPI00283F0E51|nr:S53 family peptidase [Paludisphaera borealis]MDR3621208.1 S53 family peptidase [Paludisphaera borealis]
MIRHRTPSAPSLRPRRTRRIARLCVESLETRALLSTVDTLGTILPAVASVIAAEGWNSPGGQPTGAVTNTKPVATALTPSQILTAYGFSKSATAGAGTTIAIVDAYNDPNIKADLATFDATYGLAAASLTVVNQQGQTTNLPATSPDWSLEIALDVEWAHAVAPAAKIVLVEASSTSASDLMTAVQTGARMANVVSMSWGGSEWSGQKAYDTAAYFANPNVTFVAASGDDGGAYGAEWPASSPDVVAVGGTTLSVSSSGTYLGETAWSASGSRWTGYSGSTGGVSAVETLPSYQSSALGSNYATGRVVPDVSMDANPNTGVSVYSSVPGLSQSGWFQVGGTSAGSPIWAGLVATSDQARAASGMSALSSTQTLSLLYSQYGTTASKATTYAADFHDVTSGVNFAGYASTGYDRVTGLGSPIASAIVAAASKYAKTTITTPTTPTQTVIRMRLLVHRHDETETTTSDTTVTASVVVVAAPSPTNIATLTGASEAVGAQALTFTTAAVASDAAGRALPNQAVAAATESLAIASPVGQEAVTVSNESGVARGATTEPAAVPVRGDFFSPPILDPTTPIEVWDEALAGYKDEDVDGLAKPQPFIPWSAYEEVEDDLSDAGPCLLGAVGVAAVFWMSWNRRMGQRDDDRRFRPSIFPTPSDN